MVRVEIPADAILSWKFPSKEDGTPSVILPHRPGRRILRPVGNIKIHIHFFCSTAAEARRHKKWRVEASNDGTALLLFPIVGENVRPTHDNICLEGDVVTLRRVVLQDRKERGPVQVNKKEVQAYT